MSTAGPLNGRFIGTPQELPHVCGRYSIKQTLLDIWAHLWAMYYKPTHNYCSCDHKPFQKTTRKIWLRNVRCFKMGRENAPSAKAMAWVRLSQAQVKPTQPTSSHCIVFINLNRRINGNYFSAFKILSSWDQGYSTKHPVLLW